MADSTLVQEHNQAVKKKRLLNMKEIAAALNVGRSTAFVLTASAELRSVKIGERRLVPEAALIEFLEGLEEPAAAPAPDRIIRQGEQPASRLNRPIAQHFSTDRKGTVN